MKTRDTRGCPHRVPPGDRKVQTGTPLLAGEIRRSFAFFLKNRLLPGTPSCIIRCTCDERLGRVARTPDGDAWTSIAVVWPAARERGVSEMNKNSTPDLGLRRAQHARETTRAPRPSRSPGSPANGACTAGGRQFVVTSGRASRHGPPLEGGAVDRRGLPVRWTRRGARCSGSGLWLRKRGAALPGCKRYAFDQSRAG